MRPRHDELHDDGFISVVLPHDLGVEIGEPGEQAAEQLMHRLCAIVDDTQRSDIVTCMMKSGDGAGHVMGVFGGDVLANKWLPGVRANWQSLVDSSR